jgi:hypothetical protein
MNLVDLRVSKTREFDFLLRFLEAAPDYIPIDRTRRIPDVLLPASPNLRLDVF